MNAAGLTLSAAAIALAGSGNISGNAAFIGNSVALGGIMQIGGALDVNAGNFDSMQGGRVTAQTIAIAAADNLDLNGTLSAATTLNLSAGTLLSESNFGVIEAPNGDISAGNVGNRNAGTIMLDGTSRFADDLFLKAGSEISSAGNITAGTLTGTMTGATETAQFTGGGNEIGTIGSFVMPDSTFLLDDHGPLVLDGPLVADSVTLNVDGLLTLEGSDTGGLFIHGQIDPKTELAPQPGDSVFSITGTGAAIVQTGTFYVDYGPLAGQYQGFANMPATLFFIMNPFGNISFEPAPPDGDGLIAPSIAAVFSPGMGGTISGNVNLLSLLLLNGKATDLSGTLDGLGGEAASGKGNVNPFPKPVYQFNACPIGSVNCIILPVETLPPGNPLQNFDIDQHKKKRLDKNVALPGVATRDF
jgi:hypothetical protein